MRCLFTAYGRSLQRQCKDFCAFLYDADVARHSESEFCIYCTVSTLYTPGTPAH